MSRRLLVKTLLLIIQKRASFTASLNSSVINFKYENGRRYHAQDDTSKKAPQLQLWCSCTDFPKNIFFPMTT